jgi:4'-phosphopantetheinyl transferase
MIVHALAQSLPGGIQVRGTTYDPSHAAQWGVWLSEEEQALLASFGAETRRHEFLAGRAAARQLLGACLDVPPADVPLRRAEDDAVDVVESDWQVSIAHSGGHALAAAARHAVGADLEHIRSRDPAIVDFLFASEERGCVDALPYAFDAALVLCWTLKEAVLKARRSGFRRSPKDLQLAVEPEAGIATVRVRQGRTWTVYYTRLDDYWGAVAVPNTESV